MLIGVMADTHDQVSRTSRAVSRIVAAGAEAIVHCGDITGREIVEACSRLPFYFVFGNHDADNVPELRQAASDVQAQCLEWGGVITLANRQVAITHGHMKSDVQPLIDSTPDYLLTGHFHDPAVWTEGRVRRVCPGALDRTDELTVATIDLTTDEVQFLSLE